MAKRQNWEAPIIDRFEASARRAIPALDVAAIFRGQKLVNRISPRSWALVGVQQFQFGDLRIELPDRIVVVESDVAGGVTNLVKYWPTIFDLEKPFLLLHLFRIGSEQDYISHRKLWDFLYEEMQGSHSNEKFIAWQFTYSNSGLDSLSIAMQQFERCLTNPIAELSSSSLAESQAKSRTGPANRVAVRYEIVGDLAPMSSHIDE